MTATACINVAYGRDFAREWWASFKVHDARPLGEEAIERMRQGRPAI